MREILFRAKGVDTEEWFEGWYLEACFGSWPLNPAIVPYIDAREGYHRAVEINKDTLEQYTGLTDKNGKKIFEGDILKITDKFNRSVIYDVGYKATAFVANQKGVNYSSYLGDFFAGYYELEVIGNIYDNPELLEDWA